MNIYYSEGKKRDLGQRHALLMLGAGDFWVDNVDIRVYSSNYDTMTSIGRFGSGTSVPIERTFEAVISNIYVTNPDFDTTDYDDSPTHIRFNSMRGNKINYTISNFTIDRVYGGGPMHIFNLRSGDNTHFYIQNLTISNVISRLPTFFSVPGTSVELNGINLIN